MVHELACSLESGVANFAYFFRIESSPLFSIELFVKAMDELSVNQIDEGIAYVTVILDKRRNTL